MVNLPSSPATSAAIPTTTNIVYVVMKQGGGREGRLVGSPPAAPSPASPATSAAIPTATNIAYELMKQGRGRQNRLVGLPPAAPSPASKPLEEMYEIPSQPLPVKEEEEGAYDNYSISGDQ